MCAASATERDDGHEHAMGELLVAMDDGAWKTTYLQLRDYWEDQGHVSLAEDDKDTALSEWVRTPVHSRPLSLSRSLVLSPASARDAAVC